MSVIRDARDGRWRYRKTIRLPNGRSLRISGTPTINTKIAAETAEREHIRRALDPSVEEAIKKEVPTFTAFAEEFMASYVAANNKPSEQEAKRSILDNHLLPALGRLRLDHLTVQDFERLKARMLAKNLSRKRVNNVLNVLSKLLRYALELEIVGKIPIVKTLKVPPQKFDFFTDVELERLIDGAKVEPEWRTAIVLAADAGLRMGEILALEWGDIDLKAGLLTVMRSDWRGQIGSPKGGRARKVPLTGRALAALKAHRHLRGKLVFCWEDGRPWTFVTMRAGMKRQEKRAGLRLTGWHILRHTFCSHLAMRGAAPRAIQELAGHAGITVTQRYMHLAPSALTEAIALLENRTSSSAGLTTG
jgi:integrase